jgi:membrane fusion protein
VEEASFLDKDPPPLVARGLASVMLLVSAAVSISAVTVQFSETVSAPFTLVPARGADPVRAPRTGSVTRALAVLGGPVAHGQVLFEIGSPDLSDRAAESDTLDSALRNATESLANARTRHRSDSVVAQAEMAGLTERVASLDRAAALQAEELDLLGEQVARFRTLAALGLTSLSERADAQIRLAQGRLAAERLHSERRDAASRLQGLRDGEAARLARFREEEREHAERMEHARIRRSALRREAGTDPRPLLPVVAPCAGTVIGLRVRASGAVVLEGDVLAEVACAEEALHAELDVPQAGISRIRTGQTVWLLLESFPYQRYGAQGGHVRWTSPAGTGGAGAAFPVLVELRPGGPPLVAGMRGTARVVVGRRTLLEHALEPIHELRQASWR